MKLFVVSLVAACALLLALATSALADTTGNFPEGVTPGEACTSIPGPLVLASGSATGRANKLALAVDACFGGP
jgi:hypothetical protein